VTREIVFIAFGVLTIACAFGVVISKNAVYSAFNLILTFFGLSVIYLLWGSPFIAMIQILIYTGAIVVLFVFVVMLLNLSLPTAYSYNWLMIAASAVAVWCISLLLLQTLNRSSYYVPAQSTPFLTDLRSISLLLFTKYLWPFEILSFFLLALIIAIFALTKGEPRKKEGA